MMGLQRYNPEDHNPLQWDGMMVESPSGEYYRAADVDALLARIRAAVAAERGAAFTYERAYDAERQGSPTMAGSLVRLAEWHAARAALDALLSEGVSDA